MFQIPDRQQNAQYWCWCFPKSPKHSAPVSFNCLSPSDLKFHANSRLLLCLLLLVLMYQVGRSLCLSVYLTAFVCLFVCLSVCLPDCLCVCLSVCMFVCLSVCMFVCLSVRPSVPLSSICRLSGRHTGGAWSLTNLAATYWAL